MKSKKTDGLTTSFEGRNKEYWVRTDMGEVIGKFREFVTAESLAMTYKGRSTYRFCDPVQVLTVYIDKRESVY